MKCRVLDLVLFLWGALAVNGSSKVPFSLRLFGGKSRCQGELQVQRRRLDWAGVFPRSVIPLSFGHKVCTELDCGSVLSVEEKTVLERKAVRVSPRACEDTPLIHCFRADRVQSNISLEVNCSDSVRLVSGRSLCSGFVQVRDQSLNQSLDQPWTSVCEGSLGPRGAEVLCRELGCGAPLLQGKLSPLGQTFQCEGHESTLMDCPRNQTWTDSQTCSGPALNITCSELYSLRLFAGESRCQGQLQVQRLGQDWTGVRASFIPQWFGHRVCAEMGCGCGSALSVEEKTVSEREAIGFLPITCDNTALIYCLDSYTYRSDESLEVNCSDSVRLVSGRSLCSGFVQVRDQSLNQSFNQSLDQPWMSVCEGALGPRGAEVLCRELGCGAPLLQGKLSPLGQTFQCEGHESTLMDCPRKKAMINPGTCSGPALSITCSESVRLVGGTSRCEGTLEVEHRGQWRRARTPSYEPWDLEAAAVMCRGVGCGSAVFIEKRGGFNSSDVWGMRSVCVKTFAVRDCIWDTPTLSDVGQEVVCSESDSVFLLRALVLLLLQLLNFIPYFYYRRQGPPTETEDQETRWEPQRRRFNFMT